MTNSNIQCPGCIPLYQQRHEISKDMSAILQEASRCAEQASESNEKAAENAMRVERLAEKMERVTLEFTRAMTEQTERLKHGTEKFADMGSELHDIDQRVRALEGPGKAWWPATLMAAIPTIMSLIAYFRKP